MVPSRRFAPALALALSFLAVAGCGGGEGSTAANRDSTATSAATEASERGAQRGAAEPPRSPPAPPAVSKPGKAQGSPETGDRAARKGEARSVHRPDAEAGIREDEPRTLRELDAEIRRSLKERRPRDLAELTEQILREGLVDSCLGDLKGSSRCPGGP